MKKSDKKKADSSSTFFNEWSDVIKNLEFDDTNKRSDEEEMVKFVLRSHNIEAIDNDFICNDGDMFTNIWEALEHAIWLDLTKTTIKDGDKSRNCNDYYEVIEGRPSNQSINDDNKGV